MDAYMPDSGPDLQTMLNLRKPAIAVGVFDAPPPGVAHWDGGAVPAGCVFWQKAWDGQTFYTLPADHYNCAVGAYTHGLSLPAERANELEDTLGLMVQNRYLEMAEVPGIPMLQAGDKVVAYAPVTLAAFEPSVVLVAAKPSQAMLLYEAALKAGAGSALLNVVGRPGCGVVPLALNGQISALSFGCMGNRTFTGLPDEELYVAVPGHKWEAVVEQLRLTIGANEAMAAYYRGKLAAGRSD
jgi:uncharacterized protein (DUF169 family)